jgi:hypothetical protein
LLGKPLCFSQVVKGLVAGIDHEQPIFAY